MRPPEEEIRRFVSEWMRKADLDLRTVMELSERAEFREVVAFHAQQAAEKYLKALLTRHQIEFPKTHMIRRLLDLLEPVDPELAQALDEANWLSPFGAEIRYPGDQPEMLPGDERRALQLAERIRGAVLDRLTTFLGSGEV